LGLDFVNVTNCCRRAGRFEDVIIRVISQKDGIFLEIGVFSNTSTTSWQALNIDQASERNCDD
jgi:hypothetical protein